ncbi:hypothetical protein HUN41_00217 [Streptomyces phage Coruscant]|uniref:Uncharacterized protein n=1 Tax=Streptomyces phage Coruscant TaxID=2739834 RepID=A0A7G4AWC0_9CAUD|nr:hypothetical protein PP454_gp107 [Streptomyces phage Coruscant]QMP84310.1 hypothetical protein HUN41_00217 [Streptomyces phage Coruscant]
MQHVEIEMERKSAETLLSILRKSKEPGANFFIEKVQAEIDRLWNPEFNQEARCECGHPYHRHFDSYENMEPIGCKYCECYDFKESND